MLFWLTHRRWLPMLWLLTLLALILGATLALGGLVLGTISVVSMGFAAVLLGLAVDYAVVHYQERWRIRKCPCRKSAARLRRAFCGRPSPR
jgi:predicted RND superfamily exporter protein